MEKQKNFFPSNIRFLRSRLKMTQQELADKLCVTRSKLNALESGQTKTPSPDDFIRFSEFFQVSIDTLIRIDLSKLGELKIRELQAGNDVYIKGGNLRILAISVDKSNNEQVEYIPLKAKAGYIAGYNDPEFIASLPKYSLPNLSKDGTFRIFPSTGDSMLPIPENSDIIARYVTDWRNIKAGTPCIVILKSHQDIVFKLVSIQMQHVLLESLNNLFAPYTVPLDDVLEIWKFHAYTSRDIPESESDLKQLTRTVKELQSAIRSLKRCSNLSSV